MKQIFTLLLLFLTVGSAFSQTTISGVVTDNKNNTLPGANIFLKDTYDGTTSDLDGKYSFTTTETGKQIFTREFCWIW
jgi:hypothetical protein